MKLSRRQFLKVTGGATGGLLLGTSEALTHPLVSPENKAAIQGRHPAPTSLRGNGPDYILWNGRLWGVTEWTDSIIYDPPMICGDGMMVHTQASCEELTLRAILVKGE